jgi:Fanconi anemia group M protein
METQKILKPSRLVIIADYREKDVIQHLKSMNVLVNEMNLEVGDFICSENRIGIERKTHSDFVSSIIDGRIFEQAKLLKENFERPIILIEGYSNREINENALKAALASLIVDFGVSLLNTRNPYDTARTLYWIAKKEQEENKREIGFKVKKKPKDLKLLQERIVASIPGISAILSKRLLEHFGSVEKVFSAKEEELKKVRGIGEKLASKIRKILTEKYNGDSRLRTS